MRRSARIDANHVEVVKALRQLGCQVLSLAPMGRDVPDLLVRIPGAGLRLIEIKDGSKPPSQRQLSKGQARFADEWGTYVITSVPEAIAFVKLARLPANAHA